MQKLELENQVEFTPELLQPPQHSKINQVLDL